MSKVTYLGNIILPGCNIFINMPAISLNHTMKIHYYTNSVFLPATRRVIEIQQFKNTVIITLKISVMQFF